MAVAISWTGFADTDLAFADFFDSDHTIVVRLMPQFPHAYEGPIVAENGAGTFVLGQGDYDANNSATSLLLVVGPTSTTFPAALKAGEWQQLALSVDVTATARIFTVRLDGTVLGSPVTVGRAAADLPVGTIRVGKRTTGQTVNGRNAQFYGLVDDLAVFSKLVPADRLTTLRNTPHLSGTEANLIAGFTFDSKSPSSGPLARSVSLSGSAQRVQTSAARRSSLDAPLLPLPDRHEPMDLPFAVGEEWFVLQGVDSKLGSHNSLASFCWDFSVAGFPQSGPWPVGSSGAPTHACAPGAVVNVIENGVSGQAQPPNIVEVQQAVGEICGYLHVQKDSSTAAKGDAVRAGEQLALTGDTGVRVGAHHIHLAVHDSLDQSPGFVTYPVAFRDYEQRSAIGGWTHVQRGMPENGFTIRMPRPADFGTRSLGTRSMVARDPASLDIVATDVVGRAWTARWEPGRYAKTWDRWRLLPTGAHSPGSAIDIVAQDGDRLDIFGTGIAGRVQSAAWDRGVNGLWHGWWTILSGAIPPGGKVTAVSRTPDQLDIFIVSTDGHVYTAAWNRAVADGAWQGWWQIGDLVAVPGSRVGAVARDDHKLDIFAAGVDGRTYSAAWDRDSGGGLWRGWWNILTGAILPGGEISAVSLSPGKLDIFLVSTDGGIYTAAWDRDVDGGAWRGWWRIGNLVALTGATVSAVARDDHKLDIFVAGVDNRVYTAAWDRDSGGGAWRGWWKVRDGAINPGAAVAAVSRAPGKLDLAIVGPDKHIYAAAWDRDVDDGAWRGWWRIG